MRMLTLLIVATRPPMLLPMPMPMQTLSHSVELYQSYQKLSSCTNFIKTCRTLSSSSSTACWRYKETLSNFIALANFIKLYQLCQILSNFIKLCQTLSPSLYHYNTLSLYHLYTYIFISLYHSITLAL